MAFWLYTGATLVLSSVASRFYGDVRVLDVLLTLGSAGLAVEAVLLGVGA